MKTHAAAMTLTLVMLVGCVGVTDGETPAAPADLEPPTVSITSPASDATYSSPQSVTLTAAASDDVGVVAVQFYDGATLLHTDTSSPYEYSFGFTRADNGAHVFTARAADAVGNSATSVSRTLTVSVPAAAPGTVSDLAVIDTASSVVTLRFTEVDDGTGAPAQYDVRYAVTPIAWGSASHVAQGSCATIMAGTSIGASRTCDVQGLSPGTSYQFQLVSFRGTPNVDAVFGGLSDVVSATTAATPGDTTPPTVSITSPASDTTYSSAQSVTLAATASDDVGVAAVQFYDGATLLHTDTTSPYEYSWTFTALHNGAHSITARAADAAGNSTTSSARLLTVSIAAPSPVNLAWDPPLVNTDGSPLTDLSGYLVYVDTASPVDRAGSIVVDVGNVAQHSLQLSSGTYHVAVTAYDLSASESGFSNELTITVP